MEKCDILLFRGKRLINKLIEFFTGSSYSHAALCLDEYHIAEADWMGININHINNNLDEFDVYRCNLTKEQKDKIIEYTKNHLSCKYEYTELFRYVLEKYLKIRLPDSKNKFICSEFVYDAFQHAGVQLLEGDMLTSKVLSVIAPSDLALSPLLEKVEN
jgi:uncharacterized protein YycO